MPRLWRDGETFDVWVEKTADGEALWGREGDGEPRQLETRWKFSVRGDYEELLNARLTSGWRRICDPAREVAYDEPTDPDLEAALRADLEDEAAALVYADWYQQQQHPRGELIALQHALAKAPDDVVAREAERALFAREDACLLGPIGKRRESYHLGLDLVWRNGFVRSARVDGKDYSPAGVELTWELLRHPSARFLRELVIGSHAFGDQDNQLMTAVVMLADPAPPLRTLELADFDSEIDISRAWLGDLSGLSERYPLLEDVIIKGRCIGARDNAKSHGGLFGLSLPHCRRFAMRTSGLMAETLTAILTAPWPELVELEIWTGTSEYGGTCKETDFLPLFAGTGFPKLRTLRILDSELTDELCLLLPEYVRRHPLEVLDFSLGTLTDEGADLLIAERTAFAGLRSLVVHDNCLTRAGIERMRAAGLPVVERPDFAELEQGDYLRVDGQKPERYVSISE